MKQASDRTKRLAKQAAIVSAICAAVMAFFWLRAGVSFVTDQVDSAGATDTVMLGDASGALGVEHGEFKLTQARQPSPGSIDVTRYPQWMRDAIASVRPVHGIIWEGVEHNALTHLGAKMMLDCIFKSTPCPASGAFYVELYKTGTATRATLQSGLTELSGGTETGYARINLTAANWTVTQATPSNAATASKVFTAGAAWSVTGLGIVDAASTGNLWAYSNFSRTLANTDTLTVTYTLNLQSTAD